MIDFFERTQHQAGKFCANLEKKHATNQSLVFLTIEFTYTWSWVTIDRAKTNKISIRGWKLSKNQNLSLVDPQPIPSQTSAVLTG
jgi:hypothetical protein